MTRLRPGAALVARWIGALALAAAVARVLAAASVPSPMLLAALGVGVALALAYPGRMQVGEPAGRGAQAVIGVMLGTSLSVDAVAGLGRYAAPIVASCVVMLVLGIALGVLILRLTPLDPATAILSMVPGGAVGIVSMTRDLGGDEGVVVLSQYLRVLITLMIAPIAVAVFVSGGVAEPPVDGTAHSLLWPCALAAVGAGLGQLARLPVPVLLGPMIAASACAMLFPDAPLAVPPVLGHLAFAMLGFDVGLRFTAEAVRRCVQVLPALLLTQAILLIGCFGVALLLVATTSMTLLDAYLATNPGGITAVAAVAYGSGADVGVVLALQSTRIVVMIVIAPAVVRLSLRLLRRAPEAPRFA